MKPVIHYPKNAKAKAEEMGEDEENSPGADLMIFYQKSKAVKLVAREAPIDSTLKIHDASLSDRKYEDEIYLKNPILIEKVRRGNALVVSCPHGEQKSTLIVRRGLPKFFDLRKEHPDVLRGKTKVAALSSTSRQEYSAIFDRVVKRMEEGDTFNLRRSHKANGENAQISLVVIQGSSGQVKYWVACSKNVTLLFRDGKDIAKYDGERYSFAKLIAVCWLKTLGQLSQDQVNKIEETCKEQTLVGEYCGNKALQHLVPYDEEILYFYAIVPKDCSIICWPMRKTFDFLESVGLSKVKLDTIENVSAAELPDTIEKLSMEVAVSSVEKEGEGSVLYFERKDPKTGEEEVLALCKLKTMEYRLLRKIREKIKASLRHNVAEDKSLNQFEHESEKLFFDFPEDIKDKLPPISYYKELLQTGINVGKKSGIGVEEIASHYLDFLSLIRKCHSEKRDPTEAEIKDLKTSILEAGIKNEICEDQDEEEEINQINIALLDIPGLFDFEEVLHTLEKKEYRIRYEFGEKRCPKKTFRFINVRKEPINMKKLREFTYFIVPCLESIGEPTAVKASCLKKILSLFEKVNSKTMEENSKEIQEYLTSSVYNISKKNTIEEAVDLCLLKLSRVKDIEKKYVLKTSLEDATDNLLKEVEKIEIFHGNK